MQKSTTFEHPPRGYAFASAPGTEPQIGAPVERFGPRKGIHVGLADGTEHVMPTPPALKAVDFLVRVGPGTPGAFLKTVDDVYIAIDKITRVWEVS